MRSSRTPSPDAQFLFGTDDKGRDVLSRMMYGARYSLIIGLGATAFALVCGSIIGAVAAVARKWVSEVIMRILDVIMSFPGIALAATFVLVFGNSVPRSSSRSAFCTSRRSPASCAPTW